MNRSAAALDDPDTVADIIRSSLVHAPHGFLTGPQSEARAFAAAVGNATPALVTQVHSARVFHVSGPIAEDARPEVDAMVTSGRGLALAIVTADCAPVLLHDPQAGVIGAAHAGWRGAVGGVIANTVSAMVELGADPSAIVAAIGPCIAQVSYEVDDAMHAEFPPKDGDFFAPGAPGRFQFNLEAYVAELLARAGVGHIDALGLDTYADPLRFHSYRRATHRGEQAGGRQISLIALA